MDVTRKGRGEPPRPRQFHRRRLFAGAAGSVGVAFAVACGGTRGHRPPASGTRVSGPAGSPVQGGNIGAPTAQAKRGGTLSRPWTFGGNGSSTKAFDTGLDPHPLQLNYTGPMTMFYQMLLQLNPRTTALEPMLAQKWELPSSTEYLFHLQPNVKFHDKPPASGRLMTADDAVFSLNRVRTNDPKFQNRLLLASVDQFSATDKATVRITTKAPDASLLTNLASFSVAVLAPEVVDKAGKFATVDTAVGTGAFMLQSLDDSTAVLVRNPAYWKPGLPYLDAIRIVNLVDQGTTEAAFRSGQVVVAANPVAGADAKPLYDQQQGKDYIAEWYSDVSYNTVQANVQRKPFDDPRVDRALRLMVDHDEASNQWAVIAFGRGYLCSYLPAALDGWDFTEQEYTSKFLEFKQPKDEAVKEALSLLTAAGFTRANPLKFVLLGTTGGSQQNMAELCQAQLNKSGQGAVQVLTLNLLEQAQLNTTLAQGNFDRFSGSMVPAAPYDVDSWFSTGYRTGGGRNYGKYADPGLDQMFDQQRTIFDVNQRKAYVKEILSYMMDHAPYTGWSGRYLLNVASKKVHNWAPEGASAVWGYNYEQVWME